MDANDLYKTAYNTMFSTQITLASDLGEQYSKQLIWCPGRKDPFHIEWWEIDISKKQVQRFTAILPSIDFYLTQMPR